MKKQYCPWCGLSINEHCECEREAAEEEAEFIEEYESRPDVQYGWHQQDIIDLRRRER